MKMKPLKRIKRMKELYYYDDGNIIIGKNNKMTGDCTELSGDCTELSGDCTRLSGDCSELSGDLSKIPNNKRPGNIKDWVEE